MKGIIDRFEGNYAVIETETLQQINIRKEKLPADSKVGDFIEFINGSYVINHEITMVRRKIINDLMNKAFE